MTSGRLTALQVRIVRELAGVVPHWTLSGGAALAAVHTRHRTTRDLDLFWQGKSTLDDAPEQARRRLTDAGLEVTVQQRTSAFCRLEVRDAHELTLVDLVADPVPLAESPVQIDVGGAVVWVDTAHQILVNKLCALLSRSELRDLQDVQVLLAAGGDLSRALADAPAQDGGFSPLTFAWVLRQLPVERLARAIGRSDDTSRALERFRDELVDRVLTHCLPE